MKIHNPYADLTNGQWLRGNLHAHTTRSDGKQSSQAVIDAYARLEYDFLMLSDHDIFTSAADYSALDPRGMILVPGNEVTAGGEHLLHVNATCRVEPHSDRQLVLHDIERCGGFAIINHPNWSNNDPDAEWTHVTQEKLCRWRGFKGIEIFNGVINWLHGSPYALDRWDRLLGTGCRAWGYANDDSHDADHIGLGWNVVYCKHRTVESIADALANGQFYASTGVVIRNIEVSGEIVRIGTDNAERIVATTTGQRRFAVSDGSSIEVRLPQNENYIRFECWGRGEQFAWTQPFYMDR